jgi:hypothetical protein
MPFALKFRGALVSIPAQEEGGSVLDGVKDRVGMNPWPDTDAELAVSDVAVAVGVAGKVAVIADGRFFAGRGVDVGPPG